MFSIKQLQFSSRSIIVGASKILIDIAFVNCFSAIGNWFSDNAEHETYYRWIEAIITPTREVELEHVAVYVRVDDAANQCTIHHYSFSHHPCHLAQPEVVHQECHLKLSFIASWTTK